MGKIKVIMVTILNTKSIGCFGFQFGHAQLLGLLQCLLAPLNAIVERNIVKCPHHLYHGLYPFSTLLCGKDILKAVHNAGVILSKNPSWENEKSQYEQQSFHQRNIL